MKSSLSLLVLAVVSPLALAQSSRHTAHALSSHFVMPHARPMAPATGGSVQITEVNAAVEVVEQQDRAFYKRGNRWVDSSLLDHSVPSPSKVVDVGSDEFRRLTQRLAAQGRQGCIALSGEILLRVDGEIVLVR